MYKGQTVFSQVMNFLPIKKFRQCVNRYNGKFSVKVIERFHNLVSLKLFDKIRPKCCIFI
jgi:hypothetical protein